LTTVAEYETRPVGPFPQWGFHHWVGTTCRAVHRPPGILAPTNVDRSTHVKRAQAKVEWHENRLGFSAANRSEMSPHIMMMMRESDLR
jgi:hypothetical protein